VQTGPPTVRRATVRVALIVAAIMVLLAVAELTSDGFSEFIQDHALISAFVAEAILLVAVYLVIDEVFQRRETRRWGDVTSLGVRALAAFAHRPADIVRRLVDELAVDADRAQAGSRRAGGEPSPRGVVDYQKLVEGQGGELGDWLRADGARARSFAEEMRRSASSLEEAIVRWGPTLVEDPDSAEVLNLLPDIVDSARSAAQAVAPAVDWLDRARGKQETTGPGGDWTEDDRQRFTSCLLEILRKGDEFDRRLLSGADLEG
jgi:hypothetical protein